MAAAKQTKPAAPAEEKPKTEAKPKAPKGGSVLAGLDKEVHEVAQVVEKAVAQVGGDIAKGLASKAVEHIREAVDLLAKAEREDR